MHHKNSITGKLLKGGAWAIVGKVGIAFTGLAINALLARLLSPEELGAYFLTLSLVFASAIVAQLGLTRAVVRIVAESMATEYTGRARSAVLWAIRLASVGTFVIVCLLSFGGGTWIAVRLFHSEIMSHVIGLACVWIVVLVFQQLIAEVFRGFHDIRLATVFGGLITGILSMVAFLILWWLQGHSDLHQIITLTVAAGFSSVALSSLVLWKKLSFLALSHNENISMSEILHISWPLWITSVTLFILTQADIWILGLFRSPEEVAIYGAAVRTVALVQMPLLIVNAIVPPLIAEMYAKGQLKELERTLRIVATLAGLPAFLILGVFITSGEFVMKQIFGSFYQSGGIVLCVLSIGQLVNVWSGSCGMLLTMTNHQLAAMWRVILSGSVGIGVSMILVNEYGPIGVASGSVVGVVSVNILLTIYSTRNLSMKTFVYFSVSKILSLRKNGISGNASNM